MILYFLNSSILLIKPRIFNISIDSSSLNAFSSSFLHLLQIIERTSVFSKRYYIFGFFKFFMLPTDNTISFFHFFNY